MARDWAQVPRIPRVLTRAEFWASALSLVRSPVPYVWGGSSPAGMDCSGFFRHLFASRGVKGLDAHHNTDAFWNCYPRTSLPRPGDAVLYFGKSTGADDVSHMMMYAGEGVVVGQAFGGPSDVDPLASNAAGKNTKVLRLHYRADLAGFVTLPFLEE